MKRRFHPWRFGLWTRPLAGLFLAAALREGGTCAQAPDDLCIRIADAWRAREERLRSVRIEWINSEKIPKGRQSANMPGAKRLELPKTDLVVERQHMLILQGPNQMRHESRGPRRVWQTESYEHRWVVEVADGTRWKEFLEGEQGERNPRWYPLGFHRVQEQMPRSTMLDFHAPLLAFRPTSAGMYEQFNPCSFTVATTHPSDRGGDVVLERLTHRGQIRTELRIAQAGDYPPLQIRGFSRSDTGGRWVLTRQVDFRYSDGSRGDSSRLTGWTYAGYKIDGGLIVQGDARVTALVENPEIPHGTFAFEFPVGTKVRDTTSGGDEVYIVRPGGRRRPVTQAEILADLPYDRLVSTEPASPFGGRGSWSLLGMVLVAASVAAIVAIMLVLLRSLRRASR